MAKLCPKVMSHVLQAVSDMQKAKGTSRRRIVDWVKSEFRHSKEGGSGCKDVASMVEKSLRHCTKAGIMRQDEEGKYVISLEKPMKMKLMRHLDVVEGRRRRKGGGGGGGKRRRRRRRRAAAACDGKSSKNSIKSKEPKDVDPKSSNVEAKDSACHRRAGNERKTRTSRTLLRSGSRRNQQDERAKETRRPTEESPDVSPPKHSLRRHRSRSRKGSKRNLAAVDGVDDEGSPSQPPTKRMRSRSRKSSRRNIVEELATAPDADLVSAEPPKKTPDGDDDDDVGNESGSASRLEQPQVLEEVRHFDFPHDDYIN